MNNRMVKYLQRINPVFIVLVLLLVAIAIINPRFLDPMVSMNFLKRATPLMVLAAGQVFVLVVGGFDLSVGSLITLVVVGSSVLTNGDPSNTWWVIGVMFAIGIVVGVVNGLIITRLKVPSLIATLGMMITLNGFAFMWSGGAPRGYLPENYRFFGRFIFRDVPMLGIFPVSIFALIVVAGIAYWLMHRSNFGAQVRAVGDNPRASELAGVRVEIVRILAFVCSALSAVVAGILLGGFAGVSTDVGRGFELQAITACVIGGAALLGGRGTLPGALAGALTLQAIFTLLNLIGLPKPARDVVQGAILIAAVTLSEYRKRRLGS